MVRDEGGEKRMKKESTHLARHLGRLDGNPMKMIRHVIEEAMLIDHPSIAPLRRSPGYEFTTTHLMGCHGRVAVDKLIRS